MNLKLIHELEEEKRRAEREHGPLTTDLVRATVILVEEVGEASAAVLEMGRPDIGPSSAEIKAEAVIAELIQVISVAQQMIANLDPSYK